MADLGAIGQCNVVNYHAISIMTVRSGIYGITCNNVNHNAVSVALTPTTSPSARNTGYDNFKDVPVWSGLKLEDAIVQAVDGMITGHCYTDSGKMTPLVDQLVCLMHKKTFNIIATTKTDSNGFYKFIGLINNSEPDYFLFIIDQSDTYNAPRFSGVAAGLTA